MPTQTYTVTLSGLEREDGAKPCDFAVTASGLVEAVQIALQHHLNGDSELNNEIWVESCRPGFYQCGYINDLRNLTQQGSK
jgi:hypothetical protein